MELRRAGVEGEVTARLTIAHDGSVQQCAIVRSSLKEFESSVHMAASRWIFRPLPDATYMPGQSLIIDCRIKFGFVED